MPMLASGVSHFQQEGFKEQQTIFAALDCGQNPEYLFITCSDSRIDPCLITNTKPGDLFVVRNAGNIIPPYNPELPSGEAATIEYALKALNINKVIICGHSRCGAMTGLLNPESIQNFQAVKPWLSYAQAILPVLEEQYKNSSLPPEKRLKNAVKTNVLAQIENFKNLINALGLKADEIQIEGWIYEIKTGTIHVHDEFLEIFLPMKNAESYHEKREQIVQTFPDLIQNEVDIYLAGLAKHKNLNAFLHATELLSLPQQTQKKMLWQQIAASVGEKIVANHPNLFKDKNSKALIKLLYQTYDQMEFKIDISQKHLQSSEGYRQYCSSLLKQSGFFAGKIQKQYEAVEHQARGFAHVSPL